MINMIKSLIYVYTYAFVGIYGHVIIELPPKGLEPLLMTILYIKIIKVINTLYMPLIVFFSIPLLATEIQKSEWFSDHQT